MFRRIAFLAATNGGGRGVFGVVWHGAGMPRVLETAGGTERSCSWKISVFEDVGNERISLSSCLLDRNI